MSLAHFAETYAQLNSSEEALFAETVKHLLAEGLLWREHEPDRRLYHFLLRRRELVQEYMGVTGWQLNHDERLTIFHVTHREGAHRKRLGRDTTLWLLLLRLLYAEQREHLTLTRYPVVSLGEIAQRYAEFFPGERVRKKSSLEEALRTLTHLKLVRPANNATLRINDSEQQLELLPALEIVVPANEITTIAERLCEYQRDQTASNDEITDKSLREP